MAADRKRVRTVEYDPHAGGWIARDPNTGEVVGGDDWRWNCRASARDVVMHAKHCAERTAGTKGIDGPRRGPAADGSQKPNDAAAIPCAKAGSTSGVKGLGDGR